MKTKLLRKLRRKIKLYYYNKWYELYKGNRLHSSRSNKQNAEHAYRVLLLKEAKKIFGDKKIERKELRRLQNHRIK